MTIVILLICAATLAVSILSWLVAAEMRHQLDAFTRTYYKRRAASECSQAHRKAKQQAVEAAMAEMMPVQFPTIKKGAENANG